MAWAPSASPPCFNLRAHSDGEAGKGGKIKENVFCEGINGLPNLGEEPNWPSEGGFMPSAFRLEGGEVFVRSLRACQAGMCAFNPSCPCSA